MAENNLSPETSPTGIKVKRLNRLPMVIVFVLLLATMAAFAYLIGQSGKRQKQAVVEEPLPYFVDQNMAKGLLAGKPEYGVIAPEPEPKPELEPNPLYTTPSAPKPAPKPTVSPEQKMLDQIRQSKLQRFEQALSAPISASGNGGFGMNSRSSNSTHAASLAAIGKGHGALDKLISSRDALHDSLSQDKDPNKQQRKEDFYLQKQPATEYLQRTRNAQQSPLEIKTGTVIPATMLGGLNSDLPGMILAQVSQNVYDTATGKFLLIPQGSRLVGIYDSFVAYGQDRALAAWNRLVYPDGSTLELEGMPGTDQSGYAGLEDQVDHHYFKIFGSALLISVVSGMYDYSQNTGGIYGEPRTAGDTMASAVARELSQTSQMMLRKNLDIQPTIKIRPGYKLNVMVNRDIIFPSVW